MSEQAWRQFLAADGVDDWVVLHGGPAAVFLVASLGAAAQLAVSVTQVPGIEGAGVLITIADEQLTVRLARGVQRLEPRHLELARAISAVAQQHGAPADRSRAQEVQAGQSLLEPRLVTVTDEPQTDSEPHQISRWAAA